MSQITLLIPLIKVVCLKGEYTASLVCTLQLKFKLTSKGLQRSYAGIIIFKLCNDYMLKYLLNF